MDGPDRHVVDLQLRFMKLERELADLSGVVAEQQRTIDALKVEVQRQHRREPLEEPRIEDVPPPHY